MKEKRFVGDTQYLIEQDINIDGTHYIFSSNEKKDIPYAVVDYQKDDIFDKYSNYFTSDNYLTAIAEWNKRIETAIQNCRKKLSAIPNLTILNSDDVKLIDSETNLKNKVIVINAKVFRRESRYSQNQLQFCVGGFGAESNFRGRTVLCNSIENETHSRFNRSEVIGIIKADKLPEWAKSKVDKLQANYSEPVTASASSKTTVMRR